MRPAAHLTVMHAKSPLFEAVIAPHRSLSPRGLRILFGALCLLCGGTAAGFVLLGAWPVGGFTGVELALAAFLFRLNARSARGVEMLLLTERGLRVSRTQPGGQRSARDVPTAWLRVHLEERPGRTPALLLLAHGVREEVGASLGEAEKRDLAAALSGALARWRGPRFETTPDDPGSST